MDILELLENLTVEPHQQAIIDAAVDEIERLRGQIVFERLSLRSALDKLRKLDGDIERLRKDKAELVEELWGIALESGSREASEMARAAIAKATGGE